MTFTMVLAHSAFYASIFKNLTQSRRLGLQLSFDHRFSSMAFRVITGSWPMFDKPLTNGEIYYVLCEDNVSARPIRVIDNIKDKEGKIKVEYVDDKGEKLADTEPAMMPS